MAERHPARGEMAWERVGLPAADVDLPVAVGGSTEPHRLLEAHRHGAFPFPRRHAAQAAADRPRYERHVANGRITAFPVLDGSDAYALTWWSPAERPTVRVGSARLAGDLRRSRSDSSHWIATRNHAFTDVVDACRIQAHCAWMTDAFHASLIALHDAGWAHSVEVWHEDRLIAGLFGIGMGQVFSVDSAFERRPRASRVAFAELSRRLHGRADLIDLQVPHDYAEALGARPIGRGDYLDALLSVDLPLELHAGVLSVRPLCEHDPV
ncbi:leucyl/phenylalanyl-tRNA--protein transferase [Streptacidiphilus sp. PAMC 29251]